MQGMRHQGGLRFPLSLPNGARPHEDLQKRSEELRRALLYEADDDDVAVSLDDLWKAKDFRRQLYDWINNHLPFRKDIVKIQSRFGSSVASYFMFYRFLFAQLLLASILVRDMAVAPYPTCILSHWQYFIGGILPHPPFLPLCQSSGELE